MKEVDEDVLEKEQDSRSGIVMIDEEYYFKIQSRQYVFGKLRVIDNEDSKNHGKPVYNDMLYPDTLQGVFRLYFKHKQADLTAGKRITIQELLEVVNEIKAIILAISAKLQVEE